MPRMVILFLLQVSTSSLKRQEFIPSIIVFLVDSERDIVFFTITFLLFIGFKDLITNLLERVSCISSIVLRGIHHLESLVINEQKSGFRLFSFSIVL